MTKLSLDKVKELIYNAEGKIFSAVFIKKDGSERTMNCRLGVRKDLKGVGLKFNPSDFNLITVYDMKKKAYRMINLSTIKSLNINKEKYIVS